MSMEGSSNFESDFGRHRGFAFKLLNLSLPSYHFKYKVNWVAKLPAIGSKLSTECIWTDTFTLSLNGPEAGGDRNLL